MLKLIYKSQVTKTKPDHAYCLSLPLNYYSPQSEHRFSSGSIPNRNVAGPCTFRTSSKCFQLKKDPKQFCQSIISNARRTYSHANIYKGNDTQFSDSEYKLYIYWGLKTFLTLITGMTRERGRGIQYSKWKSILKIFWHLTFISLSI